MRNSPPPPSSVEDVVELMQHIQSRLPVKDAARTSVLSKSWLHAWSTIPTLRFHVREEEHMLAEEVERTLSRYLRDNIPIESFELDVYIQNGESASVTENWIRSVATKTCSLKELSLSVVLVLPGASLTLPDEILSVAENLTKLTVSSFVRQGDHSVWMKAPVNSIINCVSLREVVLRRVRISQEVLDGIFTTCSLLKKIELYLDDQDKGRGLNTMIKIKNLSHLHEIRIYLDHGDSTDLEISEVPNLRLFKYDLRFGRAGSLPFSTYSISLGSSVTELWLRGVIRDESSLEMIKSGFPFLESLTLDMEYWMLPSFHLTCGSLKKLSLMWPPPYRLIHGQVSDVQVYAPKLLDFFFKGNSTLPSLSFPVSTLIQTTFNLSLGRVDASFFLNLREALTLSTKCDLCLTVCYMSLSSVIDLDDLRTRIPYAPANNVERLEYRTEEQDAYCFSFFDALFEICHPKHVFAERDWASGRTNDFIKLMLMVMKVLEKKKKMMKKKKKKKKKATRRSPYWTRYLTDVEIRHGEKWVTLEKFHRTSLNRKAIHYKLNWR